VLLRLAYLGVTNAFALLRLLPGSDRDKDAEILALRHQIAVSQRQLGAPKIRFEPADRALLAALLEPLPRPTLRGLRLLARPDTILKWCRDLIARRNAGASRPRRPGRPRTLHALREYEVFYNAHRPHQSLANARPLKPLPEPIADQDQLARLNIRRRDRLGGILREYEQAA
jgi:hypothetical protein